MSKEEKSKPTVEYGILKLVKLDDKNVELFVKTEKNVDKSLVYYWKSFGYYRTVASALEYGLRNELFAHDFTTYEKAVSIKLALQEYKVMCQHILEEFKNGKD